MEHDKLKPLEVASSYVGNKGPSFDLRLSNDGRNLLSASEDGDCKIWDLSTKKCVHKLSHNKESEVLRAVYINDECSLICSAGADGKALLWENVSTEGVKSKNYSRKGTLNHPKDSQIYVCEVVNSDNCNYNEMNLLTAADNCIYIWDLNRMHISRQYEFSSLDTSSDPFGGSRNDGGLTYVFDTKVCPKSNQLFCVALSDGTIRLTDHRIGSMSNTFIIHPNTNISYHVTQVNWSADSQTILAACGHGKSQVIDIRMGAVRATLVGHQGPVYGSQFIDSSYRIRHTSEQLNEIQENHLNSNNLGINDQKNVITWSSDSTIRLWDIHCADGIIHDHNTLVSMSSKFPIYSCLYHPLTHQFIIGGGYGDVKNTFVGIPIYTTE